MPPRPGPSRPPRGCACVCAVSPSLEQTAGQLCSAKGQAKSRLSVRLSVRVPPRKDLCVGGHSEGSSVALSGSLGSMGPRGCSAGTCGRLSILLSEGPWPWAPAPPGPWLPAQSLQDSSLCSARGSWVWGSALSPLALSSGLGTTALSDSSPSDLAAG